MPAIKKGATFVATVRDLASDGRGILAHPSGLTVFVPGVWPGEECRVRFIGLQNRVGLGELVELITASPQRIIPQCPHHGFKAGECGGCPWQFMDYPAQIAFKQARVEKAFERLNFSRVKPLWPSDTVFSYRNRAQLKTDGKVIGYLSANSNDLAPIQQCPVLTQPNQQTLAQLLQQLPNPDWRAKPDRRNKRLQWTSLNIDDSLNANKVSVNKRLPFQQSHHQQNARMQEWLQYHISRLSPSGPVLELFCGSGNFTEVIATTSAHEITAVEGNEQAVKALQDRALPNVTTITVDLFAAASMGKIFRHRSDYSVLVLDPPREGVKHIDKLLPKNSPIKNIFYISCNLPTLCRDIDIFCLRGFNIEEVQPLDQTPHSPHMEVLVHLSK